MLDKATLLSIRYQANDPYKKNLTRLVADMYADIDSGLYKNNRELLESPYGEKIGKVIRDRFNLNISTSAILSPISYMAIIPFSSDVLNNADNKLTPNLTSDFSVGEVKEINQAIADIIKENRKTAIDIDNNRGEIDFKKAYVRGYPSKVRHHLLLDIFFVKRVCRLTPSEVAAVVTHEVGHAFTGLSEHFRMITENKAIAKCIDHLNKNEVDKAKYVFKSTFGEEELKKAKIENSKERMDFYGAIARQYIASLESRYTNDRNDATSFEYLSDAFATNMGFGDDLASALRKITKAHTGNLYTTRWMSEMSFVVNVVLLVGVMSLASPGGVLAALFLTFFNLSMNWLQANQINIYDNFKDRNIRIKHEITHAIKTDGIPKEEIPYLIKQWDVVNNLIAGSHNYEPFTVKVMKFLSPSLRNAENEKERQKLTEEFMNNDLFVNTAKLKLLGGK